MRAFLSKPNKLYNHDSLTSDYIEELSLKAGSQLAMTNGGMTAALCTERSTREEVTSANTCDKNRASEQIVHNDVVWWLVHKNCTKFAAQTQECDHAQHCTVQYTVFCTASRCSAVRCCMAPTHPHNSELSSSARYLQCGAAGAPEQWKWTFCHRPEILCQMRVSSDW